MQRESRLGITDRRTLLKQFPGVALATGLPAPGSGKASEGEQEESRPTSVILEDSELRVTFDPDSGALTGLTYKPANWIIQRRPELGVSFRMQTPLPARHNNFILGQKQRAARVEKLGNKVQLEWKDLVSEHSGVLPIRFTATRHARGGAQRGSQRAGRQTAILSLRSRKRPAPARAWDGGARSLPGADGKTPQPNSQGSSASASGGHSEVPHFVESHPAS